MIKTKRKEDISKRILNLLAKHSTITFSIDEIAKEIDHPYDSTASLLMYLMDQELIERVQRGKYQYRDSISHYFEKDFVPDHQNVLENIYSMVEKIDVGTLEKELKGSKLQAMTEFVERAKEEGKRREIRKKTFDLVKRTNTFLFTLITEKYSKEEIAKSRLDEEFRIKVMETAITTIIDTIRLLSKYQKEEYEDLITTLTILQEKIKR